MTPEQIIGEYKAALAAVVGEEVARRVKVALAQRYGAGPGYLVERACFDIDGQLVTSGFALHEDHDIAAATESLRARAAERNPPSRVLAAMDNMTQEMKDDAATWTPRPLSALLANNAARAAAENAGVDLSPLEAPLPPLVLPRYRPSERMPEDEVRIMFGEMRKGRECAETGHFRDGNFFRYCEYRDGWLRVPTESIIWWSPMPGGEA